MNLLRMPGTPKKKVLMLIAFPLWGSGSGTYVRELANEFAKGHDINVGIVSPSSKSNSLASTIKTFPLRLPFPVAFTGHPDWPNARLYENLTPEEITSVFIHFLTSTLEAIKVFKPDIIHVHHVSILLWVADFIRLVHGIPFVVTSHGTEILAASKNDTYISQSRRALQNAQWILPVSEKTQEWLMQVFKLTQMDSSLSMKIMPGGAHVTTKLLENKKFIDLHYDTARKKVVVFSGKLTKQKGVFFLVEAAQNINAEIYILGDGPDRETLENLALKLVTNNVNFIGYLGYDRRKELEAWYQRADVVVVPSIWDEPLPLVILEAMACGTPVVATRVGGVPTIIRDKYNGLLISEKDSVEIASACNRLLGDATFAEKLGAMARKTIEQEYTWEHIAKKHIRVYQYTS